MPTLEDIEVAAQQPAPPPPTGILKYPTSSTVAGYGADLLPPQQVVPPSALDCGTLKSNAKLLPLQLVANSAPTRKEPPMPPTSTGTASQSQQQQQQQRQRRQGGWCACFGSGSSSGASEAKTPPSYGGSKSKKRKQTAQTVWSALLTNLGICMLLLAYTLLGECPPPI